ncbi:MAG: hypothetical protein A3E19_06755 [Planctomycetes bacterium RIFCSPHIGHO2_12_FULL_52_36]|nr:MAG: hypothetical protein A3D89_02035 [Planctomycetes bacterium RIFCSPHIGHO2_02_FULL_52_58]OHB93070.1 MAG: hypothetical protein A3E19_06755 [Planctomycetes bacterium RIFCSPHIGHO2_12_FULL_52_36]
MFVRMVKTKTGRKTHCYLRVVESYRSNGRVRQRVLWNMGKWERVRPGLTGLVKSLSRFSGKQFLTAGEIKAGRVKEYGNILLLKHLWEGSGFRKVLESGLGPRASCVMAMVFHKLCRPAAYTGGSATISGWLERVYLPEAERLVRLGQGRLRKVLLNSMDSLGRLEWPLRGGPPKADSRPYCVVEINPVSSRGKVYPPQADGYLVTLPLGSNGMTGCKVRARKVVGARRAVPLQILQELKDTKGVLVARYSTLGRDGVAFMDKESIPYLAFLRGSRKVRRRYRRRYLTFKYDNQKVCLRTNIARKTTPYKARRAFRGLLETEAAFGRPSIPPFVPPRGAYLKGYILVSILVHLLDKLLQKGLPRMAATQATKTAEVLDTLKEVRVVSNLLAGKRWDYLTGTTRARRTLLKAFGIKRLAVGRSASGGLASGRQSSRLRRVGRTETQNPGAETPGA